MENQIRTPDDLWNEYISQQAHPGLVEKSYSSWHFCDNKECADELLELVLKGVKKGTASALWTYENEAEPIPAISDLSIITNWSGEAKCIIKTTHVEIIPFIEVPESFAVLEGEGSKTLDEWREVHWEYFSRELSAFDLRPAEYMPVVCETFRLIYREGT